MVVLTIAPIATAPQALTMTNGVSRDMTTWPVATLCATSVANSPRKASPARRTAVAVVSLIAFGTLRRRATAYGRCVALGTIASWGGTIGHRTDPLVLCFPDMVYATTPKVELSARTRGFSRGIGAVCLDG